MCEKNECESEQAVQKVEKKKYAASREGEKSPKGLE